MSPLQQRMLEDMQLRGLSARTQEAYARAVWQLAQHYQRRPDQLGDEELRQYFLYLIPGERRDIVNSVRRQMGRGYFPHLCSLS